MCVHSRKSCGDLSRPGQIGYDGSSMQPGRALLLRLSRSRWLAGQFRRRRFARRAVSRFMPGEEATDALRAAAGMRSAGIGTVFTQLGERIGNPHEIDTVREHYLALLESIAREELPSHISVKPTQLGLELDRARCVENVVALARKAEETGSFLWLDIEESEYVDATLDLFRRARAASSSVGLCLQSYLKRTPADLESLLPLKPAIRLVKGAYREPAEIAFARKSDTDAAYFALSRRLLQAAAAAGGLAVFGTHDEKLLGRIEQEAASLAVPHERWEVHMLYGIAAAAQRALAARGVAVRVLISYGANWFPWYMRRLAERPANVWFVVRSIFR
jgi:proline dehydrogenase